MASKWKIRLAQTGMVLGGAYLAAVSVDPVRGTADANERANAVVEAFAARTLETPLEITPLEIATIHPASMVERLRVSGEIQPRDQAVLRASGGGNVLDVTIRNGQSVKAGDLLVRFDTEDLQAILKQREGDRDAAKAEMVLATQSLGRAEQLVQKNIAPQEKLDKAESELAAATARLQSLSAQTDIARTALRQAEVVAPFDGVVANRAVDKGSRVTADAELMTVVDTNSLEARVRVSTRNISQVEIGQSVELAIDGFGDSPVNGQVDRISPIAGDGARFVTVYIRFANDDGHIRGGMFATGSILVRKAEDAIVAPAMAVRKDEAGDYVLKLENGRLVRQSVAIGSTWESDTRVEISGGLVEGDRIVTTPLPELRPNASVTLSEVN